MIDELSKKLSLALNDLATKQDNLIKAKDTFAKATKEFEDTLIKTHEVREELNSYLAATVPSLDSRVRKE